MTHTPGPWIIHGPSKHPIRDDKRGDYALTVKSADGKKTYIIAEAFRLVDEDVTMPSRANAHLIAAAPDTLKELRTCTNMLKWHLAFLPEIHAHLKEALKEQIENNLEAIAQAEGREVPA